MIYLFHLSDTFSTEPPKVLRNEGVLFTLAWTCACATTACNFCTSARPKMAQHSHAFNILNWAVLKRSFISQGRKELLTQPLMHHLRGHSASLRVEIPALCLRSSLRWLTHLRVLLTPTFLWPPPFLLHKGWFIGVAQLDIYLAPQGACHFPHRNFQKVVRGWCVLHILTCKCASCHSCVQFFHIGTSKSSPRLVCLVHFDLKMPFTPQRHAIFHFSSGHMAPHPPL